MSWGAEGASTAGSGASAAGSASSATSSLGPVSSASTPASGFSMDIGGQGGQMPTDGTSVSMTPTQTSDVASYGTSNPSFFDKAGSYLDRFQKGEKQSMGEAWKGRGNNPETYGYAYNKLNSLSGMGKQSGGAAPITTNISYQQPENEYLRKRRG